MFVAASLQMSKSSTSKLKASPIHTNPSPSKPVYKKMKYKYDKYLNMFPASSVDSNVIEIRDTEIGHVDMKEFEN